MHASSSKVIAGCFGLSAFAVAIISGIAAENSVGLVLMRALIATIACYPIGVVVGLICARVIVEQVEKLTPESSKNLAAPPELKRATGARGGDIIEDEQPIVV